MNITSDARIGSYRSIPHVDAGICFHLTTACSEL